MGELNAILSAYNLAVEEVKTEFRGKKYDGLVYVPTDDKGNKISTPIHASDIGRGVGYTAVQNRMQKSKQTVKPLIPTVRNKVLKTMRTSPNTEKELQQRLEEQGLRVVIRKNESGRIYGITFIDDKEGIALNGSRLGKGCQIRRKATTLLMNLSRTWQMALSYLRATMIGKRRHGSVNFADKVKSISNEENDKATPSNDI